MPAETHYSGAGPVTTLFYLHLQCTSYTVETHYSSAGPVTTLFYLHLQCTSYTVVCDQIANKSSSFFPLNASILGKYRGKPSLRFGSFWQFIEIAFLLKRYCSKWASLKLVLSVQIGRLLGHIIRSILVQKNKATYDKTRLYRNPT